VERHGLAARAASQGQGSAATELEPTRVLGLAGGFVVFIFTAVALSAGVNNIRAGTVSFTADLAAFTGFVSWTLVLRYGSIPRLAGHVVGVFIAFLAWAVGISMIDGATRQGVQILMVLVAFLGALALTATARQAIGRSLDVAVGRCFRVTTWVVVGSLILSAANVANLGGGDRPASIVALICLGWFLAEYRSGNGRGLWWSSAIVVAIAISLSRTALFAGLVLVVFTLLVMTRRHHARNVILVVLVLSSGYWAVTSWAPLRDRFTQGDTSLSVGGIHINAEGRTKIWGVLWSEAQHEILIGRGSGAASARSAALNPAFTHPHNDYLRVVYDFGAVGIGLLTWFAIRTARSLKRIRKRSPNSVPALAALYAAVAVLIMMTTDNPLDYAFVMIPLGALIGLGLASGRPAARVA